MVIPEFTRISQIGLPWAHTCQGLGPRQSTHEDLSTDLFFVGQPPDFGHKSVLPACP